MSMSVLHAPAMMTVDALCFSLGSAALSARSMTLPMRSREVMTMASSSIKMVCPKCMQTARVTSRSTLLDCGRCGCHMEEAPACAYYGYKRRHPLLRDPDAEPGPGC